MSVRITRVNKRAEEEGVKLLIQIFFFVLLFFVAWKVLDWLLTPMAAGPEQGTLKSLDSLKIEIDNMVTNQTTVPLYVDAKHKIVGFPDLNNTLYCRGKNCICICNIDSQCQNNAMNKCVNTETNFNYFQINPRFTQQDKPKLFNCVIVKQTNKVNVSC